MLPPECVANESNFCPADSKGKIMLNEVGDGALGGECRPIFHVWPG